MSVIKGTARQSSPQQVSEGAEVFLRMLRDGSLVNTNWKQAAVFQGLGHIINVGAFSTPQVGGGNGTIIDVDQPEICISIPSGTSIIPMRAEVTGVVPLGATDADECEVLIAVDQDATGTTGTTATAETIYNMNTLKGSASNCIAVSACSVNFTTAPVLDLELFHEQITLDVQGTAATIWWGKLYGLYVPDPAPIINGPANLLVYWGGTVAVSAFSSVEWIEFPTTLFNT